MKHEVLVPLDGSVLSEAALPHAIRLAQASGLATTGATWI
jgi:hypothetical protein